MIKANGTEKINSILARTSDGKNDYHSREDDSREDGNHYDNIQYVTGWSGIFKDIGEVSIWMSVYTNVDRRAACCASPWQRTDTDMREYT